MPRRTSLDLSIARAKVIAARANPANARYYALVRNAVHCSRCGRELTDEESKRLGIGPECAQKAQEEDEV
jgi:hypothetical protein